MEKSCKKQLDKEVMIMGFFTSFVGYVVKAAVFAVLAWAGIVLGKKYRDKKDSQKANQ